MASASLVGIGGHLFVQGMHGYVVATWTLNGAPVGLVLISRGMNVRASRFMGKPRAGLEACSIDCGGHG